METTDLFRRWRQIRLVLDQDPELIALRAQVRDLSAKITAAEQPRLVELASIEAALKPTITATLRVEGVEAAYKSGYTRITWDSKKLDGYAAAHPEIQPFRKATEVAASVTFRLYEGEST